MHRMLLGLLMSGCLLSHVSGQTNHECGSNASADSAKLSVQLDAASSVSESSEKKLSVSAATEQLFSDCISNTSGTSRRADCYLCRIKHSAAALDPQAIRQDVEILEKEFPSSNAYLEAIYVEAEFARHTSGDRNHAKFLYEKLLKIAPVSSVALSARIRLADMAWRGDFDGSIRTYESVLQKHPELSDEMQNHVHYQLGLFHWQQNNPEQARSFFEKVQNSSTSADELQTISNYLVAFDNPESVQMMRALYERGLRWRESGSRRDLCWKDFTSISTLSKQPFFKQYCEDTAINLESRAQALQMMAIVSFELGEHDGVLEYTNRVLALEPTGITRQQAIYTEAYHHGHCKHWDHALKLYRQVLSETNDQQLVVKAYLEMAKAYEANKDNLGALLIAEEFLILYPYRAEARHFKVLQNRLLLRGDELRGKFEGARKKLHARINEKSPPVSLTLGDKDSIKPTHVKLAMEVVK